MKNILIFAGFNPPFYCLGEANDDDIANQLSAKRVKGGYRLTPGSHLSRRKISKNISSLVKIGGHSDTRMTINWVVGENFEY